MKKRWPTAILKMLHSEGILTCQREDTINKLTLKVLNLLSANFSVDKGTLNYEAEINATCKLVLTAT